MGQKKKTSPTSEHFAFARAYWQHGSARKAGVELWPKLKTAGAKGDKWFQREDVKLAIEAVKEAAVDRIRAEFLENDCGLSNIIDLISARLKDSATPAREFKELVIFTLDMQGHSPTKSKERPPSGNSLEKLLAGIGAGAVGGALGAGAANGRLPAVHPPFPEDTNEGTRATALRALAAPGTDVARPHGPDTSQ